MIFKIFAGLPATIAFSGTFFNTTLPIPTTALSAINMSPITLHCGETETWLPITGDFPFFLPSVELCPNVK